MTFTLGQRAPVVVLPVGSFEQHGSHLPFDTDTRIAVALAAAAIDLVGTEEFLLAPALAYSASDEHASFDGTLSAGTEATMAVLRALRRSARWASGLVVVNGHGGNHDALRAFAGDDGDVPTTTWSPSVPPGGDLHAGRTETSLALHLFPDHVRLDLARKGAEIVDHAEAVARMREGGVAAVAPDGVLGDPTRASASEGRELFESMTTDLARVLRSRRDLWTPKAT